MDFEWDAQKAQANLTKHGVSFDAVWDFEWATAFTLQDDRFDYGQPRYTAVGWIGDRLHKVVFTYNGSTVRIISMWKANRRDQRKYHERRP